MPRLSDSMEEGTILQWLKSVGDEVAVGDELVEIETDKANMAYESDVAGTLTEILVQEGETVPIGTPIAHIGDSDEGSKASTKDEQGASASRPAGPVGVGDPPSPAVAKASSATVPPTPPPAGGAAGAGAAPAAEAGAPAEGAEAPTDGDGHRPKASPLARRIARERQLDLSKLRGSGPGGRIIKADVEKAPSAGDAVGGTAPEDALATAGGGGSPTAAGPAVERPSPSPGGAETAKGQVSYEDLSKTQQVIARRMAESKATAPHFYLRASIDMSEAVAGRRKLKALAAADSVVPSFNDMVVKACALALREHPRANGAYRDGRFELYSRVNVGVAVAAEDMLVVPTVFDADRKGLRQIASEARALATKVRDGQITPPELSGATFTVSNLGMYGIDGFSAVINPPQAAILAVGAIEERPVVRDGEIATAHLMQVDLACDHRILYGAPAAEFLARIRALLEEPLALAL
ncbi:MAG TPA: dihydrolipoamide acetyltransferase family protein [Solirubrobacterales bacterium]|nr:dihydrolipoamide acetyltransferase family protein [Solirubrobacterales bacterium]